MSLIQVAGSIDAPETIREGLLAFVRIGNPETEMASDFVLAAIDTGASHSCVHKPLADSLALKAIGSGEHHIIGGGYRIMSFARCLIGFHNEISVEVDEVAIDDLGETCSVLIGRDVLNKGVLTADFLSGRWALHLDSDQNGVRIPVR